MKRPRYPKYRPSGIEWIGEIPEAWGVVRLRDAVTKIGSGKTPRGGAETYLSKGVRLLRSQNIHFDGLRLDDVAYIHPSIDAEMANTRVRAGDVLLNITGASIGRCAVASRDIEPANVNQHVCIIRPRAKVLHTSYLNFSLQSASGQSQIRAYEDGISREGLNFADVGKLRFAVPREVDEQESVSRFLDAKTAEIDALIAKKEQLVEFLEEKRSALITRAVTKGLNPDVPMKESGSPWNGLIPRSWLLVPLAHLVIAVGGGTPSKDNPSNWVGDVPWVSPKDMKADTISDSIDHISEEALRTSAVSLVPAPAILIVVRGMILAHSFPVAVTTRPVTVNQDMKALIPKRGVEPRFLLMALQSLAPAFLFEVDESGHGTKCLRSERWRKVILAVPELDEQRAIVAYLGDQLVALDALASRIILAIERLREYRTALISAAVTGKIDVRGFQPTEPCQ